MYVGICGYKGSGKTVAANRLIKKHGFKSVNFKDALIEEIKERFPDLLKVLSKDYEMSVNKLFKEKPNAVRALLINYGTQVRRRDNESYWVDKWNKVVKGSKKDIVVDDVRFWNEVSALTELDYTLIRVMRDDITTGGTHQTETEMEYFIEDYLINGIAGSHVEINKAIDSIVKDLKANVD